MLQIAANLLDRRKNYSKGQQVCLPGGEIVANRNKFCGQVQNMQQIMIDVASNNTRVDSE